MKINPDDVVALTYSQDALLATGDFGEAQQRMFRVLKLDPDNLLTLKRLANHRSQMGLVQGEEGRKTRQLIQRTERLAPDNPEVQEIELYQKWINAVGRYSFHVGHLLRHL